MVGHKSIRDLPGYKEALEPDVRISFLVPWALKERSKKIVWGGRSPALRVLLEKLVDAVEKNGQQMIGVIIDGEFEIVPKKRSDK